MTLKEKFLKIESYFDFVETREEYENLEWDKDVAGHYRKLLKESGAHFDTYKFPPISEGLMIDFVMDDK